MYNSKSLLGCSAGVIWLLVGFCLVVVGVLGDFTELLVGHPAESENTNYQNTLILMLYTSLATLPYGLEQGASVDTYALTRPRRTCSTGKAQIASTI